MIASMQKLFGIPIKENSSFRKGFPVSCKDGYIAPFDEGEYIGLCLEDKDCLEGVDYISIGVSGFAQAIASEAVLSGAYIKPTSKGYAPCGKDLAVGKAVTSASSGQWFKAVLFSV